MTLPESVAIKFGLYTLACRELLNRLPDLCVALQPDLRLDYETCLKRFDEELQRFFQRSSATDLCRAAEQFGNQLHVQAGFFRDSNAHAAVIFDDLVTAIRNQAPHWRYQADIEQFHTQGRDLARRFFTDSPWPETQKRLDGECHLIFAYGEPDHHDRIARLAESFGYHAAPLVYYANYWDDEREQSLANVILGRFTFGHDFALYLAYPFLFLHEYTAHIYSADYGNNERFNDGWMLHAAAAFLKREWCKTPELNELNFEQVGVFQERLYETLNPNPHNACKFARDFDSWLSFQLPERFIQITYELAAFQPQSGEKEHWPQQFINALALEFITDRQRLIRKIQATDNVRELMTILAPV